MKRYRFLTVEDVYSALNKLRAAFLAAKDGNDVEDIIKGVLTHDERMKIGRRIQIARMINSGATFEEIKGALKVGKTTIQIVDKKMRDNPRCFELIENRDDKVEREYKRRAYKKTGGAKLIFKKREYTGFKRKDVGR